jgi:hypothetical protein
VGKDDLDLIRVRHLGLTVVAVSQIAMLGHTTA